MILSDDGINEWEELYPICRKFNIMDKIKARVVE